MADKQKGGIKKGGIKHDSGKLSYSLLPTYPLEELARVYTIGAEKYSRDQWREGFEWHRIVDALHRHLEAWKRGETHDPDDGQLHLSSVAWCAFTLMEMERTETGTNDLFEYDSRIGS